MKVGCWDVQGLLLGARQPPDWVPLSWLVIPTTQPWAPTPDLQSPITLTKQWKKGENVKGWKKTLTKSRRWLTMQPLKNATIFINVPMKIHVSLRWRLIIVQSLTILLLGQHWHWRWASHWEVVPLLFDLVIWRTVRWTWQKEVQWTSSVINHCSARLWSRNLCVWLLCWWVWRVGSLAVKVGKVQFQSSDSGVGNAFNKRRWFDLFQLLELFAFKLVFW